MSAPTNESNVGETHAGNTSVAGRARPVHLDLTTFKFPLTSITSILHRLSGLFLFLMIPGLLWMLDLSMASQSTFAELKSQLDTFLTKGLLWLALSALGYHLVAGVKHLIMDWGVGETLEGGQLGAKITLVLSVVLAALLAGWIW